MVSLALCPIAAVGFASTVKVYSRISRVLHIRQPILGGSVGQLRSRDMSRYYLPYFWHASRFPLTL
jgi:hypothetical protein